MNQTAAKNLRTLKKIARPQTIDCPLCAQYSAPHRDCNCRGFGWLVLRDDCYQGPRA